MQERNPEWNGNRSDINDLEALPTENRGDGGTLIINDQRQLVPVNQVYSDNRGVLSISPVGNQQQNQENETILPPPIRTTNPTEPEHVNQKYASVDIEMDDEMLDNDDLLDEDMEKETQVPDTEDASSLINHIPKFSEYGEILAHLFRSLQSYRVGNLVEAYLAFEKFANAFVQGFRNWEPAWALEALYVVCYEVHILAEKADKELTFNGRSSEKLKAAGSLLMKVFGVLAGKGPKRVGALYVTCQLFKTYFKVKLMITSLEVGTVNLCRSVIRSIETARIFDFEEFPRRTRSSTSSLQSVTYMYYTGRLEVFNENFPAADTKLSYALQHCNPKRERNISFMWLMFMMILKYLIPVKLSIGIIPKDELLQKYNLPEYMNVVQALRKGDLRILRHALEEHEDRFNRGGGDLRLREFRQGAQWLVVAVKASAARST
ncbi:hypothetical protein Bca52824_016689 [Brassica carinata]|uniref:PCI domain-containing protein n=1 Tax=Brassica carinata TaxID=52824 RepID=A0A8X7W4X8_BRACI|nr:hypothetical protein Bca52824_016689 [Brassica carinata]